MREGLPGFEFPALNAQGVVLLNDVVEFESNGKLMLRGGGSKRGVCLSQIDMITYFTGFTRRENQQSGARQ